MEKLAKQTTNTILMIEPVSFGFNEQTAANNYFQQKDNTSHTDVQAKALAEFKLMVEILRRKGLGIVVVQDTPKPHTPDSIFPNNWVSFHHDGRVALYPMYAENRRAERRNDILTLLAHKGFQISNMIDYSAFEKQNRFLEGTGSMILDHVNQVAYAALSERTDKALFLQFCKDFDFEPVYFNANQTVHGKRLSIYHTNVMMCIGDRYAVVCLDTIDNKDERRAVVRSFTKTGKEIVEISENQMQCFACNMLQVENKEGKLFLAMSQSAFDSLSEQQIKQLVSYNELVPIAIPTIERYGGGSVRCMMAEVFNTKKGS
jgi:hypothetical protein